MTICFIGALIVVNTKNIVLLEVRGVKEPKEEQIELFVNLADDGIIQGAEVKKRSN